MKRFIFAHVERWYSPTIIPSIYRFISAGNDRQQISFVGREHLTHLRFTLLISLFSLLLAVLRVQKPISKTAPQMVDESFLYLADESLGELIA
jgi:hypothetical protein